MESVECCTSFNNNIQFTLYGNGDLRIHVGDKTKLIKKSKNMIKKIIYSINEITNGDSEYDECDCYGKFKNDD